MSYTFPNLDLSSLISSSLTHAANASSIDGERELYLIFSTKGAFLSAELKSLSRVELLASATDQSHFTSKEFSAAETTIIRALQWFKEQRSSGSSLSQIHDNSLNSSKFRYQRMSWKAFNIDPRVFRSLPQRENIGELYCIVRLVKFQALAFEEGVELRLKSILRSESDLLVLVEERDDLLALSEWLLQEDSLEFRGDLKDTVLPKTWRWLCTGTWAQDMNPHWANPRSCLRLIPNIDTYLAHRDSHLHPSGAFEWLITLSQNGELRHAIRSKERWSYLDKLSLDEWREMTQLSLPVRSEVQPPSQTILRRNQEQTQDDSSSRATPAYVVDYDEVLSGLGSESSTVHQVPGNELASSSFIDSPQDQQSRSHLHLSDQPSGAEIQKGHSESLKPTYNVEKNSDISHFSDEFGFDDADQSAVLDISLSELPIQFSATGDESHKEGRDESEEARALQEVKEILSSGSSLSINRSVVTSSKKNTGSFVTTQRDEESEFEEGDFVYQTLNQRALSDEQDQALPTFNERSPSSVARDHFTQEETTAEITTEFAVALEMLPTRIDLSTEEVIIALDKERQFEVTRVVNDDDPYSPSKMNILADEDAEPTKIQDHMPRQEGPSSPAIETTRSDSFNREETAKLRVRDFDMLTDIKELPPASIRLSTQIKESLETTATMSSPSGTPLPSQPPPSPSQPPPSPSQPPPSPSRVKSVPPPTSPTHTLPIFSQYSPPPSPPSPQIQSAKLSSQESAESSRVHRDRRSFSDVIRSLTVKNKPPEN